MSQQAATVTTLRGLLVLTALTAASALVWRLVRAPLVAVGSSAAPDLTGLPFDVALTALAALAVALSWAWIMLTAAAVVTQAVLAAWRTGTRVSTPTSSCSTVGRLCPNFTRKVVLAGCGLAIGTGLTVPAMADDSAGPADPTKTVRDVGTGSLTGLALPDRAVNPAAPAPVEQREVTIHAGDSLWDIAERFLPRDASDYEVTAAWHRLHRANAGRVGTDPNLIFPGTRLRLPRFSPYEGHHGEDTQ